MPKLSSDSDEVVRFLDCQDLGDFRMESSPHYLQVLDSNLPAQEIAHLLVEMKLVARIFWSTRLETHIFDSFTIGYLVVNGASVCSGNQVRVQGERGVAP